RLPAGMVRPPMWTPPPLPLPDPPLPPPPRPAPVDPTFTDPAPPLDRLPLACLFSCLSSCFRACRLASGLPPTACLSTLCPQAAARRAKATRTASLRLLIPEAPDAGRARE